MHINSFQLLYHTFFGSYTDQELILMQMIPFQMLHYTFPGF